MNPPDEMKTDQPPTPRTDDVAETLTYGKTSPFAKPIIDLSASLERDLFHARQSLASEQSKREEAELRRHEQNSVTTAQYEAANSAIGSLQRRISELDEIRIRVVKERDTALATITSLQHDNAALRVMQDQQLGVIAEMKAQLSEAWATHEKAISEWQQEIERKESWRQACQLAEKQHREKDRRVEQLEGALRWFADSQFNELHPLTLDRETDLRETYPSRLRSIFLMAEQALSPPAKPQAEKV